MKRWVTSTISMTKEKKIIALLPVKNESWILDTYLKSMSCVADEIILLDDGSTDSSISIARNYEKVKIFFSRDFVKNPSSTDFSELRQCLLNLGRDAGGTHFIWLDADEIFSSNFIPTAREKILKLQPGEKLMLSWVNLWKSTDVYVADNSVWAKSYKDFIVCDKDDIFFKKRFIHEDRTPGSNDTAVHLPEESGVVLHFNFVNWEKTQLKQALYRCMELCGGEKSVRRINLNYEFTFEEPTMVLKKVPPVWTEGIHEKDFSLCDITKEWRYSKLLELFDTHTILFFEGLEIWHIEELHNEFLKRVGREPVSKKYPRWFSSLNAGKNKINAILRKL